MKKILVLFGGCSGEYSVSLKSATAVLQGMDRQRFEPVPVGITREGNWLYYSGPLERIANDAWRPTGIPCTLLLDRGARQLLLTDGSRQRFAFDAAFPVLHGKNGEDGTLQGVLELVGIPLIGCGTLAGALCMDKDRAHKLASLAGIRVPQSRVFARGADAALIDQAAQQLGYPLFVKPVRAGSSLGVARVDSREKLPAAVAEAWKNDRELLLEENVPGFEVGCALLGNDRLTVGRVDEIELFRGFFDFEEKYTLKTSAIHCPARISAEEEQRVVEAATTIYRALDCRGFARVDLFVTPEGDIVFNEVNTIPGFTAHSRYPGMMKAAGIEFEELLTRLIETGLKT